MPAPGATLREIHRLRRAAKDLIDRIEAGPKQIKVQKQLAELEATLADDIKPAYDRLIASKGEDAMSAVENKTCIACYTGITAQNYNDLVQGRFLLCKSCGRILYLPE